MSHTFDVLYIGWSEAKGIWGDEFVRPVFNHIFISRKNQTEFIPEKLRISIKKLELRIFKEMFTTKQVKTFVDYPNIPIIDISYATKITHQENVYVCLLVLGYDPNTGVPVHLYVYQMKNDEEAARFISLILSKTNTLEMKKRFIEIENMLIEDSKIQKSHFRNVKDYSESPVIKRTNSNNLPQLSRNVKDYSESSVIKRTNSNNLPQTSSKDKSITVDYKSHSANGNLYEELKSKIDSKQCLLLPPRDYDTIHRNNRKFPQEINCYNPPRDHLPFSKMN